MREDSLCHDCITDSPLYIRVFLTKVAESDKSGHSWSPGAVSGPGLTIPLYSVRGSGKSRNDHFLQKLRNQGSTRHPGHHFCCLLRHLLNPGRARMTTFTSFLPLLSLLRRMPRLAGLFLTFWPDSVLLARSSSLKQGSLNRHFLHFRGKN